MDLDQDTQTESVPPLPLLVFNFQKDTMGQTVFPLLHGTEIDGVVAQTMAKHGVGSRKLCCGEVDAIQNPKDINTLTRSFTATELNTESALEASPLPSLHPSCVVLPSGIYFPSKCLMLEHPSCRSSQTGSAHLPLPFITTLCVALVHFPAYTIPLWRDPLVDQ